MAKPDLSSLDPKKFLSIIPEREAVIANSTPQKYEKHRANALADLLHPISQDLIVCDITENTNSAKTYTLRASDGAALAYFDAGQYLSFSFKVGSTVTTRPYSIVSSPKEALDGIYRITVKKADGGLISNYILHNWAVGTEVTASAPLGFFTYEPLRDADTVIAVAGGSGITPFLSLAKAINEKTEKLSLIILYGVRREDDILHRGELDKLCKKCDNVKVVYILSEEEKEGFEYGFITAELIKKYAPEKDYSVFLCGPAEMYGFVEEELKKLPLERKNIRREIQGEPRCPESLRGYTGCSWDTIKITVKQGSDIRTVTGSGKDTVLRILEKNEISAPSRCRSGECGFCRSRLISGEVFIPNEYDRRRLADEPCGYIHPCCTYPLSDLEIEISL